MAERKTEHEAGAVIENLMDLRGAAIDARLRMTGSIFETIGDALVRTAGRGREAGMGDGGRHAMGAVSDGIGRMATAVDDMGKAAESASPGKAGRGKSGTGSS